MREFESPSLRHKDESHQRFVLFLWKKRTGAADGSAIPLAEFLIGRKKAAARGKRKTSGEASESPFPRLIDHDIIHLHLAPPPRVHHGRVTDTIHAQRVTGAIDEKTGFPFHLLTLPQCQKAFKARFLLRPLFKAEILRQERILPTDHIPFPGSSSRVPASMT